MPSYTNAVVEWADTSTHDTVALRPDGGQVSHWCAFADPKGLIIAVAAGLAGRKVNFTTTGEVGGHWRKVEITKVH